MCYKSPLAEKCNSLNTDYRGKTKHLQCLSCKNGCIDLEFEMNNGTCVNYVNRMSLNEIKREIRVQNINLRKLCKDYNLKYSMLKEMLNNKLALSYKYYCVLEMRINEKDEYVEYLERDYGEE